MCGGGGGGAVKPAEQLLAETESATVEGMGLVGAGGGEWGWWGAGGGGGGGRGGDRGGWGEGGIYLFNSELSLKMYWRKPSPQPLRAGLGLGG